MWLSQTAVKKVHKCIPSSLKPSCPECRDVVLGIETFSALQNKVRLSASICEPLSVVKGK